MKVVDMKTETYLNYNKIVIYLTYSFLIDFHGSNFENFAKNKIKKEGWHQGSPKDRIGLSPLLSVYNKIKNDSIAEEDNYIELSIYKKIDKIGDKNIVYYCSERDIADSIDTKIIKHKECLSFKVKLQSYARIFFNGSGCITYKIEFPTKTENEQNNDIGWKHVKAILALSKRAINADGHSHIESIIDGNDDNQKDENHSEKNNNHLYNKFISDCNEKIKAKLACADVTDFKGNQLNKIDPELSQQNPNIFINLELLPESDGIKFWKFELSDRHDLLLNKNKELANILFGIILERNGLQKNFKEQIKHIRIPEYLKNAHGYLKNFSWDYRIFLSCDRHSTILVEYTKDKPKNNFIQKSLLDALEVLRCRWHFSIVLNALLDDEIDKLEIVPSQENIIVLRNLIIRRKQLINFLHDPLLYRFIGGSVTDLIEYIEKQMWLPRLKEMLIQKFNTIDRLYEDQMRLIGIEELRKI